MGINDDMSYNNKILVIKIYGSFYFGQDTNLLPQICSFMSYVCADNTIYLSRKPALHLPNEGGVLGTWHITFTEKKDDKF